LRHAEKRKREGGPVGEARLGAGVPTGSGVGGTGAGGGRAACSCVTRREGGMEAGWWAVQWGGAQLAVGRGYDRWA
jgi:hypothetical protein